MKGGRLPQCGGARRRGSPEIKQIPATGGWTSRKAVENGRLYYAGLRDRQRRRHRRGLGLVGVFRSACSTRRRHPAAKLTPLPRTVRRDGGADVGHGNVPLQVTGMLTEAAGFVAALELDTRPSGEPSWQKQTACCTLLGSSFTGSASLSVASAQAFDFQLVSVGNSIVLATGTLAVHLESFPGAGNKQSISSPVSGRQRSSWSSCALCPALCPGCSGGPPVLGQARPN